MGPHAEETICIHCLFLINYTTEAERNVCKYAALINLLEREHTWLLWIFKLHSGINRSQQRKWIIILSFVVWSLQNLPQWLIFLWKQDIKYIINLFAYSNITVFKHNHSFNTGAIFFWMSWKSWFSVIQLKLWNSCIKLIQCTQTEVVKVFGYFNCGDFGSHLTKTHQFTISTY